MYNERAFFLFSITFIELNQMDKLLQFAPLYFIIILSLIYSVVVLKIFEWFFNRKNKKSGILIGNNLPEKHPIEKEIDKLNLKIDDYVMLIFILPIILYIVYLQNFCEKQLIYEINFIIIFGILFNLIFLTFCSYKVAVFKNSRKILTSTLFIENKRLKTQEEQQKRFAYLSQMATAVAHNINNPLNNINATVTNIQDDLNMNAISNETLNNDLQRIKANIQRMAKIVSTFRSYARGNREQQEVLVFNEVIDNILMMFQGQFESHQIQLNKELTTHETKIFANTFELQEILMILLTNAQEAVENKTNATIWVSTEQDNEKVYLQIEDNGDGISPKRQKELFLPLNTSKANSFGMGLSLVKNILDNSNGYINYQQSIHGGACFRISLPIYKG